MANGGVTIHDHFDGSAHCVQCGGWCGLSGQNLQATRLIRYLMEHFAYGHECWLPPDIEHAIVELYGERYGEFRRRWLNSTKFVSVGAKR